MVGYRRSLTLVHWMQWEHEAREGVEGHALLCKMDDKVVYYNTKRRN